MRRGKRFRIAGKWWTVRVGRPPEKETLDGQCRYDERVIWLHPRAVKQDGIDIVVHEVAHAVLPAVDEEHIRELGVAVSQVAGWLGKTNGGILTHGFNGRA
jgi:hypothetical protein